MPADFDTQLAQLGWFATPRDPDLLPAASGCAFARSASSGGALAGTAPNGLTSRNGTPTSATVTARIRYPGRAVDGTLLATTESAGDGTWNIGALNPGIKFDVLARLAGENDVIASDVTPF